MADLPSPAARREAPSLPSPTPPPFASRAFVRVSTRDQGAMVNAHHALIARHRRMSDALAVEGKGELPRAEWLRLKRDRDVLCKILRVVLEHVTEREIMRAKTFRYPAP